MFKLDQIVESLKNSRKDANTDGASVNAERNRPLQSGLEELNRLIGGPPDGTLSIIGGEPGIGKKSLALALALSAAKQGALVVFFSLDERAKTIARRFVLQEVRIRQCRLDEDNDHEYTEKELGIAAQELCGLDVYIEDQPGISIGEVNTAALRMQQANGNDNPRYRKRMLVIVDNLSLLDDGGLLTIHKALAYDEEETLSVRNLFLEYRQQRKDGITAQRNSLVATNLRDLARRLRCPVIACCNIPRKVTWWADGKKPTLQDLRAEGVNRVADIEILVDRSRSIDEPLDENGPDLGKIEIVVAKNGSGSTGSVTMNFDNATGTFV